MRTLAQGATAVSLMSLYQAFSPWPMNEAQMNALGPWLTLLLTVAVTLTQNAAERAKLIPTLGVKGPDPTVAPPPDGPR